MSLDKGRLRFDKWKKKGRTPIESVWEFVGRGWERDGSDKDTLEKILKELILKNNFKKD